MPSAAYVSKRQLKAQREAAVKAAEEEALAEERRLAEALAEEEAQIAAKRAAEEAAAIQRQLERAAATRLQSAARRRGARMKARARRLHLSRVARRDALIAACGRAPSAASCCRMSGDGLTRALVWQVASFTIEAHDEAGRRQTTGGDSFFVAIRASGRGTRVRAKVVDLGDGTYRCIFKPPTAGLMAISVSLMGESLPGSPSTCSARSAKPRSEKCFLSGEALTHAVSDTPSHFFISFRDALGNLTHAEELDVFVRPYELGPSNTLGSSMGTIAEEEAEDEAKQLDLHEPKHSRHPRHDQVLNSGMFKPLTLKSGFESLVVGPKPLDVSRDKETDSERIGRVLPGRALRVIKVEQLEGDLVRALIILSDSDYGINRPKEAWRAVYPGHPHWRTPSFRKYNMEVEKEVLLAESEGWSKRNYLWGARSPLGSPKRGGRDSPPLPLTSQPAPAPPPAAAPATPAPAAAITAATPAPAQAGTTSNVGGIARRSTEGRSGMRSRDACRIGGSSAPRAKEVASTARANPTARAAGAVGPMGVSSVSSSKTNKDGFGGDASRSPTGRSAMRNAGSSGNDGCGGVASEAAPTAAAPAAEAAAAPAAAAPAAAAPAAAAPAPAIKNGAADASCAAPAASLGPSTVSAGGLLESRKKRKDSNAAPPQRSKREGYTRSRNPSISAPPTTIVQSDAEGDVSATLLAPAIIHPRRDTTVRVAQIPSAAPTAAMPTAAVHTAAAPTAAAPTAAAPTAAAPTAGASTGPSAETPEGRKRRKDNPPAQRILDAPLSQRANNVPPSQRANNAPSAQRANNAPSAQRANNAPPSQRASNAPSISSQHTNNALPVQRANDAPSAQRANNAPPAQRANTAPPSQRLTAETQPKRGPTARSSHSRAHGGEAEVAPTGSSRPADVAHTLDDAAAAVVSPKVAAPTVLPSAESALLAAGGGLSPRGGGRRRTAPMSWANHPKVGWVTMLKGEEVRYGSS